MKTAKTEALLEGSRKRFGNEFHVDGTATANARPVDVAELSVDGWQPSEDAVAMQSQRLVSSVLSDTMEKCRSACISIPDPPSRRH